MYKERDVLYMVCIHITPLSLTHLHFQFHYTITKSPTPPLLPLTPLPRPLSLLLSLSLLIRLHPSCPQVRVACGAAVCLGRERSLLHPRQPHGQTIPGNHTLEQILDRSTVEIKEFQADPSFQGGRDREGGRKSRHFDMRVYAAVSVCLCVA